MHSFHYKDDGVFEQYEWIATTCTCGFYFFARLFLSPLVPLPLPLPLERFVDGCIDGGAERFADGCNDGGAEVSTGTGSGTGTAGVGLE
jgi:hypothetical protein